MASWQQTLAELARDQAGSPKRQAFLLCGDDGQAEDLLQDARGSAADQCSRTA